MTPRTAKRTRDPERTRAAILEAARGEFVEHGLNGARTGEIAKRAGVPQGLLYHYFENKEDLFDRTLEEAFVPYFEGMITMLETAEGEPQDPDLLARSVRFYFDFLADNPHIPRLLAWWHASQRWTEGHPICDSHLHDRLHELGERRIREGQEAGILRRHLEPGFVIKMFLDLCLQYHVSVAEFMDGHGLDPTNPQARRLMDRSYLESMLDIFLHGVTESRRNPS